MQSYQVGQFMDTPLIRRYPDTGLAYEALSPRGNSTLEIPLWKFHFGNSSCRGTLVSERRVGVAAD